uniref:BTB domain-containing protein n=1 Tax=Panagrolaimus sp. ES5 TaxID=591445 RepID=A0AC34FQQ0_9BILA
MFAEVGKVDVNAKCPILMEWIIDEGSLFNGHAAPLTKDYEFPGFASFKYSLSHGGHFDEEAERFDFELYLKTDICDSFDMEVDLTFTINGEEPKKIVQKLRVTTVWLNLGSITACGFIPLWTDLFEVLINHLDKNRQITLQLSGTLTLLSFENEFKMHFENYSLGYLMLEIHDKDKDFIIVAADGKEIEVHKLALQNQSKVFTAMFENSWKEAVEGRVVIPDFSSKVIEFAIELCYRNYANCDLDSLEFIQLFLFADKYDMEEMKVHKLALQKQSKVFTAMFENSWKEAVEGRVVIPDFSSKVIEFAIELCYKHYANYDLDSLEYIQLFLFADKYDMEEMKECIKESIVLTPGNICEYANLYYEQKCEELLNYCIDRLIVYFQYSYPVSNMNILNNDIKLQFFERASISKAMKKEIQFDYYKNK